MVLLKDAGDIFSQTLPGSGCEEKRAFPLPYLNGFTPLAERLHRQPNRICGKITPLSNCLHLHRGTHLILLQQADFSLHLRRPGMEADGGIMAQPPPNVRQ